MAKAKPRGSDATREKRGTVARSAAPSPSPSGAARAGAPTRKDLTHRQFDTALLKLQRELVIMQEYVSAKGLRIVVIFKGRDAAGKGKVIKPSPSEPIPEDRDQQRRRGDHEQLPRPARAPSAQHEQRDERAEADRRGACVDPVHALAQPTERRLEGPGRDATDAEKVRELRGDDDQRHRRGESDQHRPREQVREEPEMQRPREQHDDRDLKCETRREPRRPGDIPCAIGAIAAAVRIELVDVGPTCAWRSEPANP